MTAEQLSERLRSRPGGEEALASIAKLGFDLGFVAANVLSGAEVTVANVAMLWMGMPNKHDRKRTAQLFDLLTQRGIIQAVEGSCETWRAVETA